MKKETVNMNIIFDFDSTLISEESLEVAMKIALQDKDQDEQKIIINKIIEITNLGMEGKISLKESIKQRMSIAQISKSHLSKAANICSKKIIPGMNNLIKDFQSKNAQIFIVSGGPSKCVYEVAKHLNIPKKNVKAVKFVFDKELFNFEKSDIDSKKIDAVKTFNLDPNKTVAIGDGSTDLEIWEQGLASYFIGFCQVAQREKILKFAPRIAHNINELKIHLDEIDLEINI